MKRIQSIRLAVLLLTFSAALVCWAQGPATLTPDQATLAVAQAKPGDVVLLADGTYRDTTLRLKATGTATKPITLSAQTPGKVIFTGKAQVVIAAEHLVVRDLVFAECKVANKSIVLLENARSCRITACRFTNSIGTKNDQVIRVAGKSKDNRIDRCSFIANGARGVQVVIDAATWMTNGYPVNTRIDHNRFQDIPGVEGGNGREAVQVGQGGASEAEPKTVVEHNVFLRCNGENECISSKTSGNTYRYNLLKDQGGALSIRGAANCCVEGNRLENTPGIRVHGSGHVVVNNVIVGNSETKPPKNRSPRGNIMLGYGMPRRPPGSEYPQHYTAAASCLVANNTVINPPVLGITIGGGKGHDWGRKGIRSVPPSGNRIVNNIIVGDKADLMLQDDAPDNVVDHNLVFVTGGAKVSSYGANAIKEDPRFVNAAGGDYRLAPDSPALEAGLSLPGFPNSVNIGAAAEPLVFGSEDTTEEKPLLRRP